MQPTIARQTLLAQHERIRGHLAGCAALAQRIRNGEPVHAQLDAALDGLRRDFAEHNVTETAVLRPLLASSSAYGHLLIDRMLEEHVAEHAAFWVLLSGSGADLAERIYELAEELDAHMAAEERTFLSPMTLRDDVIRARTRELVNE